MTRSIGTWGIVAALGLAACGDAGRETGDEASAGPTGVTLNPGTSGDAPTVAGSSGDAGTDSATGSGSNSNSDSDATTTPAPTTTEVTGDSSTGPAIPPGCGNGVVDGGEACDDGEGQNGAGKDCLADCTKNVCGDGDKGPLEACDEGAANGPDGGCSAECSINPSSCGDQSYMAALSILPVDVIIFIDNSGSMGNEILGVQTNINVNFANIFENSGIDYRVILVSRHGAVGAESVCIEAPLSGIPQGGCANPPAQPVFNPGKFYHYSVELASHDGLCKLLSAYDGTLADDFGLGVGGWQQWLRPEASKSFIVLTDDGVTCSFMGTNMDDNDNVNDGVTTGDKFDNLLLTLAPEQFGMDASSRRYQFYSIAGMPYNNPKDLPYEAKDPIVTGKCPTAVAPGSGYQQLSKVTNALRFPLCDTTSYSVIFQAIASGVIDSAALECEFPIPEAPEGKMLDTESIVVEFTPDGMGMPIQFTQVASLADCTPSSFYIDATTIYLCPAACDAIQGNIAAELSVNFTCEPIQAG